MGEEETERRRTHAFHAGRAPTRHESQGPKTPTLLSRMCGHVKDGSAYVDAIREHFCSAGLRDDSFMSTPVRERDPTGRQV